MNTSSIMSTYRKSMDPPSILSIASETEIDSLASSSSYKSSKPRVRFDTITIRNYNVTVSDHPSCSSGAPIGLSWEYDPDHIEISVEKFEDLRGGTRRNKCQMQMPADVRHDLLLYEFEVPKSEIFLCTQEVCHVKKQRTQTAKQHEHRRRMKSFVEIAAKPLRRLVGNTSATH